MKKLNTVNIFLLVLLISSLLLLTEGSKGEGRLEDDDQDVVQTDIDSLGSNRDISLVEKSQVNLQQKVDIDEENTKFSQKGVKQTSDLDNDSFKDKVKQTSTLDLSNLRTILNYNQKWSQQNIERDPSYFIKHHSSQQPKYLWIGCSDSRVLPNQILGLQIGELFVLRNVANIVSPSDISSMAAIQFAIQALQVTDILVAGHYGCGGVLASITKNNNGPLESWLSKLRRIRLKNAQSFKEVHSKDEQASLLVQINVKEQVLNVASTQFVQKAWRNGQQLRIHGVVYDMRSGRLTDLGITMHNIDQLPDQLLLFER